MKIDAGRFVVSVSGDMLIFAPKGSNRHLTLHFGRKSGEADLHLTVRARGKADRHRRLFAIRHEDLLTAWEELRPTVEQRLARLIRPLTVQQLADRHVAVIGAIPTSAELHAVTRLRRSRIFVDQRALADQMSVPDSTDDLIVAGLHQIFALYNRGHRTRIQGYGFTVVTSSGRFRPVWIPCRELGMFVEEISRTMERLALKYRRGASWR
jgi:hypothetical protein